jgi:PAS domain S-box-containing protein
MERARGEAARRDSDERYRLLFESIDSGFCVIEMIFAEDGHAIDYRFIEANPAFEHQSGLVDAVGRRIREFAPDLEEHWFERYGRVALTGVPLRVEGEVASLGRWFDINAFRVGAPEQRRVGVLFTDISDRKQAEVALRTSQEQFQTLLDQAPVGVYLVDGDFLIRQVNPIALPVFGDIPGGPVGRDFDEIIHILWEKRYADEVVGIFRHTLETGEPYFTAERAEQRSDRSITEYYEWRVERIILPDGRHGVVCYFRDVSAQVHARREIEKARDFARDSEERYRLIVDNARDYAIIITDRDDIITEWLPGAEAVFGWTREEAIGRPAGITFTPEDQAERVPEREIEIAARDGEAPDVRWHQRNDGSHVYIEGKTSPLYNEDGSIRGFLKIGQDVSERRSALEALEASELRMRTLVTGIPQMVFRSHGTGERIWGSPQWIEYTGVSFEESVGYGWLDGMHPEDRESTLAAWSGVEGRGEYYCEHRILHAATGDYRWHQTRAAPLRDKDGSIIEWLGTSTDVEELRRLQQRQGLLLAELQHRVRNILAMLRSVAGRTAETAESVEDYWQHLEGRISTMARTQGLLTRGIGSGLDLQNLVLDELLAQAAKPDRFSVTGPDVTLSGKAAEVLGLAIHELATNSVKYGALSADDGRVDIRWALLEGEDKPRLSIIWSEFGVRMNEAPRRPGFGMELITERVPYELQGSGSMDFRDCGLVATIEFPLLETPSILQTDAQVGGTVG